MTCTICSRPFPSHPQYLADACPGCRLTQAILAEVKPSDNVIDVGCGPGSNYSAPVWQRVTKPGAGGSLTVLDAHWPYFLRARWPENVRRICGEALSSLDMIDALHFDVALGIDFPEHFTPEQAKLLLRKMQKAAAKVLWFVPLGAHPQEVDHYHAGAEKWQTHRSLWTQSKDEVGQPGPSFVASLYGTDTEETLAASQSFSPVRSIVMPDFHVHDHSDAPGAALLIWEY